MTEDTANTISLDFWRLSDELSVIDAALLIVGKDPSLLRDCVDSWQPDEKPQGYDAVRAALQNAILANRLNASIRCEGSGGTGYHLMEQEDRMREQGRASIGFNYEPNWKLTTIQVSDLTAWLKSRGFSNGFFFSDTTSTLDYLNAAHPNYAPKLAAAVEAWQAVASNPSLLRNKTAKQALDIWLRKNADKFGLTNEDGNPNKQGIEEISKIANWNPKGGAPKTPSGG